ncbi:hypothetical protein FH5_00181 [Priestia endophytica]|nr:hypothetical protein FH5_00181 [Priestia endophytica]
MTSEYGRWRGIFTGNVTSMKKPNMSNLIYYIIDKGVGSTE